MDFNAFAYHLDSTKPKKTCCIFFKKFYSNSIHSDKDQYSRKVNAQIIHPGNYVRFIHIHWFESFTVQLSTGKHNKRLDVKRSKVKISTYRIYQSSIGKRLPLPVIANYYYYYSETQL